MLADTRARWLVGGAVLAVLAILVYWLWQPGGAIPLDELPNLAALTNPAATAHSPRPIPGGPSPLIVDPLLERSGADIPTQPDPTNPTTANSPTSPPGPRLIPPTFTTYTTDRGDTMERLALRYYGSAAQWTVIARANPLIDPNRLRPGLELRIPDDPANVQGVVLKADPTPAGAPQPEARPDPPAEPPVAAIDYTVRPGDTLSEIAARYYGSTRFTDFLYEANRDRLTSKSSIRVGQTLKIPPKPSDDGG